MEERGLGDLIAIVLRKWRTLIVFALIFAVLLGGFQGWRVSKKVAAANTPAALEKYEQQLADYEAQKQITENKLGYARSRLASEEKYKAESPIFSLDPGAVYKATIVFAIDDIEMDNMDVAYFTGYSTNPVDYVLTKIKNQYSAMWMSADLGALMGVEFGMSDMAVREIITLGINDGAMMQLQVSAPTAEETEALAKAAYKIILGFKSDIEEASFSHSISILNESTRLSDDNKLKAKLSAEEDTIAELRKAVTSLETELANLNPPSAPAGSASIVKGAVKYAVVGAVLGLIIGAVWVMFIGMTTGLIMNSVEIENSTGLAFLGSAGAKHRGISALADAIAGERVWKSRESGAEYIAARLGAAQEERKSLLFASTLEKADEKTLELLKEKLAAAGYSISCCIDAQHSAAFVSELNKADALVLLEKVGTSRINGIIDIVSIADSEGTDIAGFVCI